MGNKWIIFCIALLLYPLAFAEDTKILAYNVYLRPGIVGWWDYKSERFVELVEATRPYDIVGLSEVFDDELRAEWKNAFYSTHPYQVEPPKSKNPWRVNGGITLFSRYPIQQVQKMIYKNGTGVDVLAEKGAIFARIAISESQEIEVVLSHVQAGTENFEARQAQFDELQKFIDTYHQQGCPLFLIGDFNVRAEEDEQYPDMLQRFSNPVDSYRFLKKDPGYTINGEENPLVGGSGKRRIDYVLMHDRAKKIVLQDVAVNKFPMKNSSEKLKYMSDHYGVEASISNSSTLIQAYSKTDLMLALNRSVKTSGILSVYDAQGQTHQQSFLRGSTTAMLTQVATGNALVCVEWSDQKFYRFMRIENTQQEQPLNFPEGNGRVVFTCPKLPIEHGKLRISGPVVVEKTVASGNHYVIENLPAGKYQAKLDALQRSFCVEFDLSDTGHVALHKLFSNIPTLLVCGKIDIPTLMANLINVNDPDEYINTPVENGNFRFWVNPGKYILRMFTEESVIVKVVDITSRTCDIEILRGSPRVTVNKSGSGVCMLVWSKSTSPASHVTHFALSNSLVFSQNTAVLEDLSGLYNFALYKKVGDYWKLSSSVTVDTSKQQNIVLR